MYFVIFERLCTQVSKLEQIYNNKLSPVYTVPRWGAVGHVHLEILGVWTEVFLEAISMPDNYLYKEVIVISNHIIIFQ
jgi:hypothetical protein